MPQYYLIVPASGLGKRMNANLPKQYLKLDNGLSVLEQTLQTLLNIKKIKGCVIALSDQDTHFAKSHFHKHPKILATVQGGKERFHSVFSALEKINTFANDDDWVLVHDAARPCVKAIEVEQLIQDLENHPTGGLLATPIIDTVKQVEDFEAISTLDRSKLWRAQTPQMYRLGILNKALKQVIKDNVNITDEASSIEYLGLKSHITPCSQNNIKITTPEDLDLANFYLRNSAE